MLGHEVAGVIEEVGAAVQRLRGRRSHRHQPEPARAALCRYCQHGLQNHCLDMRYYGSAMRMPHVQGAFRQRDRGRRRPGLPAGRRRQRRRRRDGRAAVGGAACGEPRRAAARQDRCSSPAAGRSARWWSSPRAAPARRTSSSPTWWRSRCAARAKVGADEAINVAEQPDALAAVHAPTRASSTCCSRPAATSARCARAFDVLRPRGVIVQVGLRRRDDAADQHHRRQGVRPARRVPLPRGVRRRGRAAQQAAWST